MAQLETRSEQLTVEDNKTRCDQRNTNREQLIVDLSALQSEKDTSKVVDKLNELGFTMEEGFADKSLKDMQTALGEAVDKLQEYASGVIKVSLGAEKEVQTVIKDQQFEFNIKGNSIVVDIEESTLSSDHDHAFPDLEAGATFYEITARTDGFHWLSNLLASDISNPAVQEFSDSDEKANIAKLFDSLGMLAHPQDKELVLVARKDGKEFSQDDYKKINSLLDERFSYQVESKEYASGVIKVSLGAEKEVQTVIKDQQFEFNIKGNSIVVDIEESTLSSDHDHAFPDLEAGATFYEITARTDGFHWLSNLLASDISNPAVQEFSDSDEKANIAKLFDSLGMLAHPQDKELVLVARKDGKEFSQDDYKKINSLLDERFSYQVESKEKDPLVEQLAEVTEGRYLSVEAMNEVLQGLKGVNVEIPEAEMARLNGLRPAEISEADMDKMETMKDQTEDEQGLMVMQLPEKIMVDGKEKPFTIATMQAVMQAVMEKAANADNPLKPLYVSDYVPGKDPKKLKAGEEDIYNKVWPSDLQAWTSACLKGSKNKNYKDQLAHQAEILGEGNGIEADMFLAMTLRYISSKEELIRRDYMRLNTRDTDGDPLRVYSSSGDIRLASSDGFASSSLSGFGASLRISS